MTNKQKLAEVYALLLELEDHITNDHWPLDRVAFKLGVIRQFIDPNRLDD